MPQSTHAATIHVTSRVPYTLIAGNTLLQLCSELHKFTLILVAVGTLQATTTHMGLVAAAPFVGLLMFGLVAGALCENLNPRVMLACIASVKLCVALVGALLVFTSSATVELVVMALLVFSICDAFYNPVFISALSRLSRGGEGQTDGDAFSRRLAISTTLDQVVRVAVPAVTGSLIGLLGPAVLLSAAAVSSVLSALCFVSLIQTRNVTTTPSTATSPRSLRSVFAAVHGGVRYVYQSSALAVLVGPGNHLDSQRES